MLVSNANTCQRKGALTSVSADQWNGTTWLACRSKATDPYKVYSKEYKKGKKDRKCEEFQIASEALPEGSSLVSMSLLILKSLADCLMCTRNVRGMEVRMSHGFRHLEGSTH